MEEDISFYFDKIISKSFLDSHTKQKNNLDKESVVDIFYKEKKDNNIYIIGKTANFHFLLKYIETSKKSGFSSVVMHENLLKILNSINEQKLFNGEKPEVFYEVIMQKKYLSNILKENIKIKKITI